MPFTFLSSIVTKMVLALMILGTIMGGFWYVGNLQRNLAVAEQNQQMLKEGIDQQQELIASMRVDMGRIQQAQTDLLKREREAQKQVQDLQNKFTQSANGQARDLGALSVEKPGLIEDKIDRGTRNAMRCMELAMGAPRTEAEINATKRTEINGECPQLANPNFKP